MASPTAKVRQDGTLGDIRVSLDVLCHFRAIDSSIIIMCTSMETPHELAMAVVVSR